MGSNCFGKASRDTGHSLVPAPPDNITGRMSGASEDSFITLTLAQRSRGQHREAELPCSTLALEQKGSQPIGQLTRCLRRDWLNACILPVMIAHALETISQIRLIPCHRDARLD